MRNYKMDLAKTVRTKFSESVVGRGKCEKLQQSTSAPSLGDHERQKLLLQLFTYYSDNATRVAEALLGPVQLLRKTLPSADEALHGWDWNPHVSH